MRHILCINYQRHCCLCTLVIRYHPKKLKYLGRIHIFTLEYISSSKMQIALTGKHWNESVKELLIIGSLCHLYLCNSIVFYHSPHCIVLEERQQDIWMSKLLGKFPPITGLWNCVTCSSHIGGTLSSFVRTLICMTRNLNDHIDSYHLINISEFL